MHQCELPCEGSDECCVPEVAPKGIFGSTSGELEVIRGGFADSDEIEKESK